MYVADGRLPREDPTLRLLVGLERAVPVQMVRRQVEQDRDPGMQRALVRELEGRGLDDQHVVPFEGRGGERPADVAARDGVQPAGTQARREHARGRRLPVRSGHGEVRHADEPGPQLELAPHGEVALPRPPPHLGRGWDPGTGHDERRPFQMGAVVTAGANLHAEPLERIEITELLAGTSLGDHHGGALVRKRVGRRDPRDAGADHDHALVSERAAHDGSPSLGMRALIPSLRVR